MSWDLVQWAVAANDTADAVAALERDEQVTVITVPIPDVVHALISGEDLEAEGEWDNPGRGRRDLRRRRHGRRADPRGAGHGGRGVGLAGRAFAGGTPAAERPGGCGAARRPAHPEIADHLKALYAEIRDFYAAASAKNAYVLKWPS